MHPGLSPGTAVFMVLVVNGWFILASFFARGMWCGFRRSRVRSPNARMLVHNFGYALLSVAASALAVYGLCLSRMPWVNGPLAFFVPFGIEIGVTALFIRRSLLPLSWPQPAPPPVPEPALPAAGGTPLAARAAAGRAPGTPPRSTS